MEKLSKKTEPQQQGQEELHELVVDKICLPGGVIIKRGAKGTVMRSGLRDMVMFTVSGMSGAVAVIPLP